MEAGRARPFPLRESQRLLIPNDAKAPLMCVIIGSTYKRQQSFMCAVSEIAQRAAISEVEGNSTYRLRDDSETLPASNLSMCGANATSSANEGNVGRYCL